MLLRLYLPVIVLLCFKILSVIDAIADTMLIEFQKTYQRIECARADVYERNLEDAFRYLKVQYPYLNETPWQKSAGAESCGDADFVVYREVNPKLPLIYPNWLALESKREEEGKGNGQGSGGH